MSGCSQTEERCHGLHKRLGIKEAFPLLCSCFNVSLVPGHWVRGRLKFDVETAHLQIPAAYTAFGVRLGWCTAVRNMDNTHTLTHSHTHTHTPTHTHPHQPATPTHIALKHTHTHTHTGVKHTHTHRTKAHTHT